MLRIRSLLLMGALAALEAYAQSARSVSTNDGLAIRLESAGTLQSLSLDQTPVDISSETGGFHVTEFSAPDGRRRDWGVVRGKITEAPDAVELLASLADASLDLRARFRSRGGHLEVDGEIADRSGQDRALLVTFLLPVKAAGWWWSDDIDRRRRIESGGSYDVDDKLGEKRDILVSRVPFTAISSERESRKAGLSLAVPMHEPRVFRLFYDEHGYQVSFQLGLAPAVSKDKARASFRFVLYRHDPAWGFRSAAQRYYEFFPELYLKRVERDGTLGSVPASYLAPHLEDFAASFMLVAQVALTTEQAAAFRENGLQAFKHREPWAWWHRVQFADKKDVRTPSRLGGPGDPPQPSLAEELAIIEKKTHEPPEVRDGNDQIPGPVREVAAAAQRCFIYDENNQPRRLLWHLWSTRDGMAWHSQIPLNVNPRIPSPNRSDLARRYQFQNVATWDDPKALHVNGVSFDSLTNWTGFRWEDYRRENFGYATIPLTFCPRNGRVVQITGFHDWEMVKVWAEEIRSKGRLLVANTDTQPALFCGQYLDLMAFERSPNVVSEEELALVRTLCYRKPAMYYRSVNERGLRKCLFYAVFPTAGVVGRPAEADAARPLYKKYAPLIRKISMAGWQPVTHARFRNHHPGLKVERFGDAAGGVYLAARNAGAEAVTAELEVNLGALGFPANATVRAQELVEKRPVAERLERRTLVLKGQIGAGETLVFSLGSH